MTDSIFFDTDCISAFLWVNNQSLLAQMYKGKIVIPYPVYNELSNPRILHLKSRVDTLIKNKYAFLESIDITTEEYQLYKQLTSNSSKNHKIIGKGEAASIVLTKK